MYCAARYPEQETSLRSYLASLHAAAAEQDRFLSAALGLPTLPAGQLAALNVEVPADLLTQAQARLKPGLFERRGS